MRLIIQENYNNMSQWTANYVASKINKKQPTQNNPFVLGLPTGGTPLGTFKALIELHKQGKVSFEHVITFNMDEYIGLDETHDQSYHYFMKTNFFDHIDIKEENINILDGMSKDPEAECTAYEEKIKAVGGIDLFLGGVGADGHIAFNEPGSSLASRTRIKTLAKETIESNSRFFGNDITQVPQTAMTVGIGTILDAEEVVIMINGLSKARALAVAIEGAVNHIWTITALQMHRKAIIVCDEAATHEIKVGTYKYFKDIERNNLNPDSLLK